MDPPRATTGSGAIGATDDPVIVLIAGTAGCGKTTLANRLAARLDLDHRIGTGFIRAVLQSQTSVSAEPDLFLRSYEAQDAVAHLQVQARRLRPAVLACVERARAEGTSLVVEGTHLVPELYRDIVERVIVLASPDLHEHERRLVGQRHTRRTLSDDDVRRVREIGLFYEREANRLGLPIVRYANNFDEVLGVLRLTAGADDAASGTTVPLESRSSEG
jgi:2-phosphoglycerate kinase